ncbi:MAG: insulinase family protein, partial [Pseudomonadota bacterium]|nr:insulinase family protein [Pseudomonadota bacterium]
MRTLIPNLRRPALSLAAAGSAVLIAVFSLGQPAADIDIQVVPITDEVDAWLVEDHTNPLITLKFGFEGGSRWDEPGKEGTTSLAFGSLNEGAGEMNAETFLGLLQDEAVSMAGSAGFKWSTVSFQTPTASIDFAFEQLETMLTDPAFDPEGVERMRRDALASAAQRARAPGAQLGEAFFDALWGEDDPRNRKFSGDLETIPAITQADLFAVKDRIIGRNNVIIAAVGDITPDELRRRVAPILARLPEVTPPDDLAPPVFARFEAPVAIDFDQTQTIVYAVAPAFPRTDPDNFAARVVSHILGAGGLSSRLSERVRNQLG